MDIERFMQTLTEILTGAILVGLAVVALNLSFVFLSCDEDPIHDYPVRKTYIEPLVFRTIP